MIIYYNVITIWCKYPFQDVVDEKYVEFSYSKRKFKAIKNLKIDSNTSVKDKEDYIKKELNLKKFKIEKIK